MKEPFTLLLHVLQNNGTPVPPSLFTVPNTAELVQDVTGTVPVNVEVVTDREVVIDLRQNHISCRGHATTAGELDLGGAM